MDKTQGGKFTSNSIFRYVTLNPRGLLLKTLLYYYMSLVIKKRSTAAVKLFRILLRRCAIVVEYGCASVQCCSFCAALNVDLQLFRTASTLRDSSAECAAYLKGIYATF